MSSIGGVTGERDTILVVHNDKGGYVALKGKLKFDNGKFAGASAPGYLWDAEPKAPLLFITESKDYDPTTGMARAKLQRFHFVHGLMQKIDDLGEVDIDMSKVVTIKDSQT